MPVDTNDVSEKLKKLPGELKHLLEKRIELFTIEFGEQITKIITQAIYRISGLVLLALGLIFLLQALALFVGDLINDDSLGYVLVSLPIILIGIMLMLHLPKSMVRRSQQKMMDQIIGSLRPDVSAEENDKDRKK